MKRAKKPLLSVAGCHTRPRTATKIPLISSFSGNSVASVPTSTFMCLWAIYIVPGSVHIFPPAEKEDRLWEYINHSQTHECGNWDWDPNIPFLGILVSKFRCFVFAVRKFKFKKKMGQTAITIYSRLSLTPDWMDSIAHWEHIMAFFSKSGETLCWYKQPFFWWIRKG